VSDAQARIRTDPASPEAVFALLNELRSTGADDEERYGLYADDVVIEFPFAPQGRPRRLVGRAALREFYDAVRARSLGHGAPSHRRRARGA
jgi:hypothetical protein